MGGMVVGGWVVEAAQQRVGQQRGAGHSQAVAWYVREGWIQQHTSNGRHNHRGGMGPKWWTGCGFIITELWVHGNVMHDVCRALTAAASPAVAPKSRMQTAAPCLLIQDNAMAPPHTPTHTYSQ